MMNLDLSALRKLAILQIVMALGLIGFWVTFFTIGLAPQEPPPGYFVYELAFPFPDGCLALSLLLAAAGIFRNRPAALYLTVASLGGLIFLGLLDLSFNWRNGIFMANPVDATINGLINITCVLFGSGAIFFVKQNLSDYIKRVLK
ncbi:MAG: hypothetical protein HYR55_01625 [Acidobacteria bacterium]|nr:hypothetical protein [Acidobacteriota bacterium]MBI3656345.1 hypothetical protein [Acidobacteriota bacterium]